MQRRYKVTENCKFTVQQVLRLPLGKYLQGLSYWSKGSSSNASLFQALTGHAATNLETEHSVIQETLAARGDVGVEFISPQKYWIRLEWFA